ncbi:MAG: ATP-binding protein, partial [Lachnospiraceae bacterium]|nr:ATP-binding protein [Lachnospiraceae bacterium]
VIYFCVYFLKKHATHNFLVYTEDLIAHFLNDVLIVTEIAGAFIFTVTFVYGTVGRHYVAWILYLCCVVLLMAFICLYLMLGRQQKRMRATDQRLEILNHSYRETVRLYRERDKIYHDLKNHILVMDGLLASGQTGKLAAYFHEIEQPIIGSSRLINTGNEIIDLVMNYKMSVARMKNIDFHFAVQGNCKNKLRLPDGEVCALFANVTDNAIEACEIQKTLQRKISMHIKAEKQMFFVEIRNTYDNEHTEKKPEALHKNIQYGGPHGIGMQNVREIVEKYQGHCECIKDNQLFCVRIMFF